MSSKPLHFAIALMLALPAAAGAQARPTTPAAPNFDVLTTGGPQPGRATRDARAKLQRSLGRQAVVSVDPATGTVRNLQRLDGALSAPSSADAASAALDYVRSHATAIGLTRGDLSGLTLAHRDTTADGVTHLRWTQSYGGIPLYGADLRVNLDRANRVINVGGSPLHDLSIASTTPKLSAADALAAVRTSVHGSRRPAVTSQSGGARRHTRFAGGDTADLVLVTADGQVRLAWALTYGASSTAHYFAIVDATTGRVVKRENLVLFVTNASVFKNYPGAAAGGSQVTVDIAPFLSSGTTLSGPNAHAYADLNDNDQADGGENVVPGTSSAFTDFTSTNTNGGCDASHKCSWDSETTNSWTTNKNQNVTQVFWYVNNFHDHLLSAPIGFDSASGNFQGDDPVQAEADDGASTGPDSNHVDNANMLTFPDGFSPIMQMYLFFNGTNSPFREINGGDAAAVVYHEYTHGLTSRLDTDSLGLGALFSAQSGAMGEAWSDFYAMDFLVRQGFVTDTNANGDIDLGAYTDATPNQIRTQPMDCPVGSTTNCPGTATAGAGGYTFGDFANICNCTPNGDEVHADGEIWGETLWDLRQALVTATGSDGAGSDAAEHLVTGGLRLAPPEPSFLDMRNAILAQSIADGGTYTDLIWQVFANRGMGFLADTTSSADLTPTEDFSLPPAPGGPAGTVSGTVTDAGTGAPVSGATVGFPPYTSAATPVTPTATGAALTGADGTYSFSAPAASYPTLTVSAPGYDQQTISTATVLNDGDALTRNFQLRRDWASRLAGGRVTSTNDDDLYPYAGADRINDQDTRADTPSGWATYARNSGDPNNPHPGADPTLTIQLPGQVDISSFGIDPANSFDPTTSILKTYRIDTSADGSTWTTAVNGSLSAGDAGRINEVSPIAGTAQGARFVRFTMLTAQSNTNYIDATELEVYGTPTNQLPSGTLDADATTIQAGGTVHFTASMTDPDSAIAGYDWDFNGDGAIDASTTDPTAAFTYPSAGTFTAKVFAKDSRGGAGTATRTITVTGGTPPPPPPPKPTCSVKKLPSSGKKGKLSTKVTCTGAGKVKATLKLSKKVAKKLRLKSTTAGSASRSVARAGTVTVTIKLTSKVRKAMRSRHLKKLKLTLQVTASPAGGKAVGAHRTVTIRI